MLRTKLFGTSGMLLILSSLLFRTQYWSYPTRILMVQTGILAMGLGFFFRLNSQPSLLDSLAQLDDIENGFPK